RGTPAATTRLELPPADLHECKGSTAETEDRWVNIVAQGGAAFGLSLDMPAFGEAGTPAQIRAVVRYARSLCGELGWPPGELNFPRAFLVEKAYPEDEVVIADQARGQEYIYEHRLGKRFQVEASARTALDGQPSAFDGVTAALKYNVWHSLERRALVSVGLEAAPASCSDVVVSSPSEAICRSVAADVCSAPCAAVSAMPATSSMRRTTSRIRVVWPSVSPARTAADWTVAFRSPKMASSAWRTAADTAPTPSAVRRPCSMAPSSWVIWSCVWRTRARTSSAERALCSASLRTSSATTRNPNPCWPARAASIAALRASRSVWLAIRVIASTSL